MVKLKADEYELAREVESLCSFVILENPNVDDVTTPSSKEDMYLHYDLVVHMKNGKSLRVDVKGLKSLGHGRQKSGDYHWIELKNVSGAKGWLYGKADLIAFQTSEDDFMFVERKKLVEFTEMLIEGMEDKTIHRTDPHDFAERYIGKRIFTRDNGHHDSTKRRLDQTVLVKTEWLEHISANPF